MTEKVELNEVNRAALALAGQVDPMEVDNARKDRDSGLHIFENSLGQSVHVTKERLEAEVKALRGASK